MPKFELFVNELVNHQHRVVVEAESEDEVIEALEYADDENCDFASDYISCVQEKLTILEVNDDYSEDVKEVECDDCNEIKEQEEN